MPTREWAGGTRRGARASERARARGSRGCRAAALAESRAKAPMATSSTTTTTTTPATGALRVGTAGFAGTSQHWAGPCFPPGAKSKADKALDFFQEIFDVVEVNGTCHAMPTDSQIAAWKSHAAGNFEFCLKVHHTVTHDNCPQSVKLECFATFLARAAPLGTHLGPLLLQFPRSFNNTADNKDYLRALATTLAASPIPSARIALEVRHPAWLSDDAFLTELRSLKWALVQHPNTLGRATIVHRSGNADSYAIEPLKADWPITAGDWTFIRLHGYNDEHTCRITDADLKTFANDIHSHYRAKGIATYAFILNDDAGAAMPINAKALKKFGHAAAGEMVPRAPKQAKSIASFFAASPHTSSGGNKRPPQDEGGARKQARK